MGVVTKVQRVGAADVAGSATLSSSGASAPARHADGHLRIIQGMTRSTTLQEREARIRALPELSGDELLRYGRHLVLPDVGPDGQRRLKAARVLLVGAGGLGSPVALYLAAAGVGTLGLVDFDVVDLSNLQRQVLHGTSDVGRSKLDSARDRIHDVNPHVAVDTYGVRLTSANA